MEVEQGRAAIYELDLVRGTNRIKVTFDIVDNRGKEAAENLRLK
jgi:hypothetical protein